MWGPERTLFSSASEIDFVDFSEASFRPTDAELAENKELLRRSLTYRPRILSRNDVSWIATHAWRTKEKGRGLAALKQVKRHLPAAVIDDAAEPIATIIRQLVGGIPAHAVTCPPCGHSRRPDCFGARLARRVAEALEVSFIQVFADRPCGGTSHPRQSAQLRPLTQIGVVPSSIIVVDDLATSGRHLEEMVLALRQLGSAASAFAWISGYSTSGIPLSGSLPHEQQRLSTSSAAAFGLTLADELNATTTIP